MTTGRPRRRNIEAECLREFETVVASLGMAIHGRGYGTGNRFDPDFDLQGQQRFQFGDLRIELGDRIVVIEVESSGGVTNLVKYWPLALARSIERPVFLLHAFGQNSRNDYISHLQLWDFTWAKMRSELWAAPRPMLFARRYPFTKSDPTSLKVAAHDFRRCLTDRWDVVCREVFGFTDNAPSAIAPAL